MVDANPYKPGAKERGALRQAIEAEAARLGFEACAIVPAERLPTARAYQEWLSEGRHGAMHYMENHQPLRVDPRVLEPGTRSVIVLLSNYRQPTDRFEGGLRVASYAHGDDYHDFLWDRMRALAAFVHNETGVEVATRPAVDSAPLLERDLARMAGLGWVGKNALLIRQGLGSFTIISEVLVGLDLGEPAEPAADRCGRCTRCLDACPTGAIIAPQVIDARRCISYLTIELRGPIPRRLRPLIGDHLFGCDICQTVCPWNRRAPLSDDEGFAPREAYRTLSPLELLSFDHPRYVETFRRSPMKRAKLGGLKRNAAVVVGNTGSPDEVPALIACLEREDDSVVRGHIAWALGRLGGAQAAAALRDALAGESDPMVLDEIRVALQDAGLD
ncbi:tRNA epoxyqueuosine(34) reductase QueG [Lujinxingia vulgaris]|uniref:tRNA epoxyqueuosine(34) reductase QueG n=1 Tax=Lujinxingia vulgaris TaxID=2600176 RepID=A0A5C6WV75_9DELT|nr:tRNA epoxyqueuosine(34) reductase QueG [Lujinxingia vulgaris]TXD32630.1 tRNA epoxyqueuosine(34) reductase QueG [Lujinxingia vulgaris]